jgi:hypothetical protein
MTTTEYLSDGTLPKYINVSKLFMFDVADICETLAVKGGNNDPSLDDIMEVVDAEVKEIFGSLHRLIYTDEDGEEL